VLILIALSVSAAYWWLYGQIATDRARYAFLRRPAYSVPAGFLGCALIYLFYRPRTIVADMTDAFLAGFDHAVMGLLWIPCGFVALMPFGLRFVDLITGAGNMGIRNLPSFDQAMAAERRHDFGEAERLYRVSLEDARERGFPEADWAEGFLALGNLLQRLDRLPEAAACWEKAAAGNILADKALVAALRAAEFWASRNGAGRAIKILEDAIRRFPKDPITPNLHRRLRQLSSGQSPVEFGG